MSILYTIGYEGATIDEFVSALSDRGIKTVIDVREYPLSRKFGFSKNRLSEILARKQISYFHFPQLGSPKEIRDELRLSHDYEKFFQKYRIHACYELDSVVEAIRVAEHNTSALLCFERDVSTCHRHVLSEMMCSYSPIIDEVRNIECPHGKEASTYHGQNIPQPQPAV